MGDVVGVDKILADQHERWRYHGTMPPTICRLCGDEIPNDQAGDVNDPEWPTCPDVMLGDSWHTVTLSHDDEGWWAATSSSYGPDHGMTAEHEWDESFQTLAEARLFAEARLKETDRP